MTENGSILLLGPWIETKPKKGKLQQQQQQQQQQDEQEVQRGGEEAFERNQIIAKSTSERFILKKAEYGSQYAPLYFARLKTMKPWLQQRAKKSWGASKVTHVPRILELKEDERCYVIGTLFKDMPLKPSVLAEYAKERAIVAPPPRASYVTEGQDQLILEDESGGRVTLVGASLPIDLLVSGMVVAVKGRLIQGEFEVDENTKPRYIAFISGLRIGSTELDPLSLQLLFEYLEGYVGSSTEHAFQSSIVRVVIAGNSFSELITTPADTSNSWKSTRQEKAEAAKANEDTLATMKELDRVMAHLSSSIPVDIMAGSSDPSNFNLPQQPMNPCLFPQSYILPSFSAVPNPYEFELDGITFLGTSGQPIDNIHRYIKPTSRLQCLEDTLRWRHLAPTAPDTLGCYPFEGVDPFIITSCPHVYFAANQPEFGFKVVDGDEGQSTRLLLVPSFASTGLIALLNLETLDCQPIKFSTF